MIAYLDCSTGVSGDKFLGALLDVGTSIAEQGGAGFTAADLGATVSALAPEAVVAVERVLSHGVSALGVRVTAASEPHSRTWADVRALLEGAELPAPVRSRALAAFEALAKAEAAAHGTDVDSVHFHEVGAIDSITDIVGVCAGLHALGVKTLIASTVAVGSGTVTTSHGVLPVPAPATAALLVGVPLVAGEAVGELTTPTGAALLGVCANGFAVLPPMTIRYRGYGAGTRDIGAPNVCTLILGEASESTEHERVILLETNIDHVSAEELAFAAEELLGAGALDVWQTPIVMKKGRSAVTLSVLVRAEDESGFAQRMIGLTGSLGVRSTTVGRHTAARETREIETPWGPARVKIGAGRVRPEFDDVARISREHGLAFQDVAREIARLASE